MNQTILFRFTAIINFIILYIYGCVTFEDNLNAPCTQLETFSGMAKSVLQCIIQNPMAKMESTNCSMKRFNVINVSMLNLEAMEKFFLNNNETVVKFLQLFKKENYLSTALIIEIKDLLSASIPVNLAINKQWITKYFGHLTDNNLLIYIHMKADDWSQVNLTIHADVNDISKPKTIELCLEKSKLNFRCTLFLRPTRLYNATYMKSWCEDYLTYVDHHGNAVPWSSTDPPIVRRTTTIGSVINYWSRGTTRISKPFVPFTIRNTIYHRQESSSGFWAYILSPIVAIIIILSVIIYCIMKKNRKTTIGNNYSQPITTAPTYTYNLPMYHSPAYNQK